jgi:O-antigen/teichoic acid export membrane protein
MQLILLAGMPVVYTVLLPKYRAGLLAGEILVLGSYFVCLLRNGANYLIATHKERLFLKYIVFTLIFNVVADLALVKAGWGLEGVALGTAVAGLLLSTLVWRRVLAGLGFTRAEAWSKLLGIYLPCGVLTALGVFVHFTLSASLAAVNMRSVGICVGLFVLNNAAVCCFPLYRNSMSEWKRRLLHRKRSVPPSLGIVDATP